MDGKRWVPVPDATATAEEFIAALSLLHETHQQIRWSPWVMQDRAGEYDAALKVCGEWTSAEPESPGKTLEEYEAELEQRMAEADARFLAAEAQAEKDRAERAEHYDEDRAQARKVLLEELGILDSKVRERDDIISGELFPGAPEQDKRRLLANLERDIAAKTKEVDQLLAVVGDPETVADAKGRLPAERREMALVRFKSRRGLASAGPPGPGRRGPGNAEVPEGPGRTGETPRDAAPGPGPLDVLGANGPAAGSRHVLRMREPGLARPRGHV